MNLFVYLGTFWDRKSGKMLHNFVTWQDVRCKDIVKEVNNSIRSVTDNEWSTVPVNIAMTLPSDATKKHQTDSYLYNFEYTGGDVSW